MIHSHWRQRVRAGTYSAQWYTTEVMSLWKINKELYCTIIWRRCTQFMSSRRRAHSQIRGIDQVIFTKPTSGRNSHKHDSIEKHLHDGQGIIMGCWYETRVERVISSGQTSQMPKHWPIFLCGLSSMCWNLKSWLQHAPDWDCSEALKQGGVGYKIQSDNFAVAKVIPASP